MNNLEKEFVPYEQALALKELGFDEPCFGFYVPLLDGTQELEIKLWETHGERIILAPTFSQCFRWLREKYNLYSHVIESIAFDNTLEFVALINGSYINHGVLDKPVNRFETYEEAELQCLIKLIEIVKK